MSFSYYSSPKFTFKPGARVKGGVDAQTIGEALSDIEREEGAITPEAVVDSARPEDSPLHPCFTWDDRVAAEEFRKSEARNLVRVVRVEAPEAAPSIPAFVNVQQTDEGAARTTFSAYVSSEKVAKNVGMFDYAWRAAHERVMSAQRSLADLERMVEAYGGESDQERAEVVRLALAEVEAASQRMKHG